MREIELMLRERIGLDPDSIGSGNIQRCVRQRMKQLGVKKAETYRSVLAQSELEWNELVEAVIVPETWFFRDREPFYALRQLALNEWLPAHPNRTMRLLSVPCSSGEEPYSLAMTLLEAGIPAGRFQVQAVDISATVLARAQRAIYGANSFRGGDLDFRSRFFRQSATGYELSSAVRGCVRFRQGNLLNPDFLEDQPLYDFIFCRNLLIYFDRPTQRRALEVIRRRLAPAGVLFTGAAEQPLAMENGFVSARIPMAFACRRSDVQMLRSDRRTRATPPVRLAVTEAPHRGTAVVPAPGAGPSTAMDTELTRARRLADAGRLKEAAEICEAHLLSHGASAEAYYLLGLVKDASSDSSALECYRKALYLEPGHYETLLQMALLSQKNGDAARARSFRNRAERSKRPTRA